MPFTYITGSGTQQNPYVISSLEAWNEFVTHTRTNTMANQYVELGADIEFNDTSAFYRWTAENPPANITTPMYEYCQAEGIDSGNVFAGHFNGKNHKFIGMFFNKMREHKHYMHVLCSTGSFRNVYFYRCWMHFGITDSTSTGDDDNGGQLISVSSGSEVSEDIPAQVKNIIIEDCHFYFEGNSMHASLVSANSVEGLHLFNSDIYVNTSSYATFSGFFGKDITATDSTYFYPIGTVPEHISLFTLANNSNTLQAANINTSIRNSCDNSTVEIDDYCDVDDSIYLEGYELHGLTLASIGSYNIVEQCGTWTNSSINGTTIANNATLILAGLAFTESVNTTVTDCFSEFCVDIGTYEKDITVQYTPLLYQAPGSNIEASVNKSWAVPDFSSWTDNDPHLHATVYNLSNATITNSYAVRNPIETAPDYSSVSVVPYDHRGDAAYYPELDFDTVWRLEEPYYNPPEFRNSNNGSFDLANITEVEYDPEVPEELYELTLHQNYDNYGTVTGAGNYAEGDSVVITATPASGYYFVRWNDGNTNNPRTITMPAQDTTYTAGFGYNLVVESEDTSKGTVTGGGLHCPGESENISATPAEGYKFVQWNDGNTDNPRHVWADNLTFTAYFAEVEYYTLDVSANFPAMGTVTGGGSYEEGSTVTVTATAEEGYHFVQWDDENTDNPRTITMNDDVIMEAQFAADVVVPTHALSLAANYSVMGSLLWDLSVVKELMKKIQM